MDRQTVEVYETRAAEWRDRRRAGRAEATAAFADRALAAGATPQRPVVDLGCGPGWHTAALPAGAIALDAAAAMLRLVPDHSPGAPVVQADLAALPFRRGALGGAWASKCYIHLPRSAVPAALADLHGRLVVGAPLELLVFAGDAEFDEAGAGSDDFAGRRFSTWPEAQLRDVIEGAGFILDELEVRDTDDDVGHLVVRATRAETLPDVVGPGLRLLVVGLNPSPVAAEVGVAFARAGNRFWPAALDAGVVTRDRDPRHAFVVHHIGFTDLCKRTTAAASTLTVAEYRHGAARLERLVAWLQPQVVCVVGLAGWRAAVDRDATAGTQPVLMGGRPVYLMPNTSGRNASTSRGELADHLRTAAALADASRFSIS